MTAKEYLKQANYLTRAINGVDGKIEEIDAYMKTMENEIQHPIIPGMTSPEDHQDHFDRIHECRKRLVILRNDMAEKYNGIIQVLDKVESPLHRNILKFHYLDRMPLRTIADLGGYAFKYVQNLHGEALQALARLIAQEDH